ncbi:hypothetical protein DFA_02659 [Cavenderia fasciculata]|uniref:Uncharacterized protein n=1 Tax=Cavenderia fasciculata TaxID=261658 RepID=F4Q005_CACFS|nr:uncharacterized protein DFA_02659 [Cavenderia fasciculata]EGG18919.1 hypothetical protein DFA_02659 [Cavenderia fasciculata]|eukprot:XP_004357381.1 hypothetical protein DFA_02659 [Cavenderia fasciculata]
MKQRNIRYKLVKKTSQIESEEEDENFRQEFLVAKSRCPIHKDRAPSIGTYNGESMVKQTNQQRFGIALSCKRLFSFVSKYLIKKGAFKLEESEISKQHQHFSNQYCLLGKSINALAIEVSWDADNNKPGWKFLELDHYSKLQSFRSFGLNYLTTLPSADTLFPALCRLKSLTSLDLSPTKLDSARFINKLKNTPLRKLYFYWKDSQFLFNQNDDSDEDTSGWPLTQSLEAVSINSFDVIPKLDRLPKLRHLRIIIDGENDPTDAEIQSMIPSGISKLSFNRPNTAKMSIYNPQVNELLKAINMKQRNIRYKLVKKKSQIDSDTSDVDDDREELKPAKNTRRKIEKVKHVTKRRKNSNNKIDLTDDQSDDSSSNSNSDTSDDDLRPTKTQYQQRKRSSNRFNSNNKRIHLDDDDDESEEEDDDDDDDSEEEEVIQQQIYKEPELKKKLKKDLILICQSLNIKVLTKETKDTIINQIIKTQSDQVEFKRKMIDNNNSLCDFNKGPIEYSLPWPIISRILDLVWTGSNICTCYYSHQLIDTTKPYCPDPFDYYQMWPVFQPLLEQHKESRMKCPMHTYHYLNNIMHPTTNMFARFISESHNDANIWRYQLLGLSKRIYQYLSYKHLTNIELAFGQDTWNHINNKYCPIKAPKVARFRWKPLLISGFKNLTSLNISRANNWNPQLLEHLPPGMIKLLLPWNSKKPIKLNTNIAKTIRISNVHPQIQMPNLHTYHVPYTDYKMSQFDHPKVTKLVDRYNKPEAVIVPPTIDIFKLCEFHYYHNGWNINTLEPKFIKGLGLKVKQLIISCKSEISDKTINLFKQCGFEYQGAKFKGSSIRQFHFIKTKKPTLVIPITNTPEIVEPTTPTVNNSLLPYYLIEKIVRYSWNSYYCTCEGLSSKTKFSFNESQISQHHEHFSNQYCLLGKPINALAIDMDSWASSNNKPNWKFLELDHYSKLQSFQSFGVNYLTTLPSADTLFPALCRLKSLTSLDLSHTKLDSARFINKLKNLPLRKLYFDCKDSQFLFSDQNDDDEDTSGWPLTQSLEAIICHSSF